MNVIAAGTTGEAGLDSGRPWVDLGLSTPLARAARLLSGSDLARSVQALAAEMGVFSGRRHVVVSAPTNSGKTQVGYLLLAEALMRGQRAVLLEPLRALAQEKADELTLAAPALGEALGVPLRVVLSTGDYRLQGERFTDPVPRGELLIATPERMEAVLRQPDGMAWMDSVGVVCVDEAHLIGDARRGPTLEFLVTALLARPQPPRLVLLSATLQVTEQVTHWLRPCDVVQVSVRHPPLHTYLADLDTGEDATAYTGEWLKKALANEDAQAIVFIHQARHTQAVALKLTEQLGSLAGRLGAVPYNSKMSLAQRQSARRAFMAGDARVVVATSSLAMGVNLPATHVVVRDLTYIGAQSPGVAEILQMAGRAGRGDRDGHALVIKQPHDRWVTESLLDALRSRRVEPLRSSIEAVVRSGLHDVPAVAGAVASLLHRSGEGGMTNEELNRFFEASLGGAALSAQCPLALRWMEQQRLAYQDPADKRLRLTRLGSATVRSVLPLPVGARFGALMRDLLVLGEDHETLGRWSPLDHLILLGLVYDEAPTMRRFSAELARQVDAWCEGHPQDVPVLYRRWLRGERGHSSAAEVLGSIGLVAPKDAPDADEWARQKGYLAVFGAIVLLERARGRPAIDLERQFAVANLVGIEERWRDTVLWLVGGMLQLLDVRTVFFHLKEECDASAERIKLVKGHLASMRQQALLLLDQLRWASPLGSMLLSMRRRSKGPLGIGERSIRVLEGAGLRSPAEVAALGVEGLTKLGLVPQVARRLSAQARRMVV